MLCPVLLLAILSPSPASRQPRTRTQAGPPVKLQRPSSRLVQAAEQAEHTVRSGSGNSPNSLDRSTRTGFWER